MFVPSMCNSYISYLSLQKRVVRTPKYVLSPNSICCQKSLYVSIYFFNFRQTHLVVNPKRLRINIQLVSIQHYTRIVSGKYCQQFVKPSLKHHTYNIILQTLINIKDSLVVCIYTIMFVHQNHVMFHLSCTTENTYIQQSSNCTTLKIKEFDIMHILYIFFQYSQLTFRHIEVISMNHDYLKIIICIASSVKKLVYHNVFKKMSLVIIIRICLNDLISKLFSVLCK